MAHFVADELRNWLLAYAATFAVGVAAWLLTFIQLRVNREDNRDIVSAIGSLHQLRGVVAAAMTALALGAWALYDPLRLEQWNIAVAAIALAAIVGYVAASIPYWNRVGRYLRVSSSAAA